jgi:DNA polymerase III epsilon subunit-like protein
MAETFLFFDTETTGTPRSRNAPLTDLENWPRVVQVAWLLADDCKRELESGEFIIYPDGFTIPDEAQRIHGISTAQAIREGVPLSDVLSSFNGLVARATRLVAHNFEFDSKVLGAEFLRLIRPNPLPGRGFHCTMKSGTDICRLPGPRGQYKWPTLAELHRALFGTVPATAHRALADVRSCSNCYFEMVRRHLIGNGRTATDSNTDDLNWIEGLIAMAEERDWFDDDFLQSVYAQCTERGTITARQREALENIEKMFSRRS